MNHRLPSILLAVAALATAEPAAPAWPEGRGGSIPDSSFECGHDWWSLERAVYLDAGGGTAWLPAVDDPGQPWHGALSLRIDNPRGDGWQLTSGDVGLEEGVDYVLAFSARAAVAGIALGFNAGGRENDHWGRAGGGSWKLGTSWERRTVALKADRGHRWFNLSFFHDGQGGKATTGTVWLDAVQVQRAPVADYAPPVVEAGVREPARFYALDSQGPWPVAMRVRNHADQPRAVTISWEVVDTADGRTVRSGRSAAIDLPAATTVAHELEVSPRRRGSFDLHWQVLDAASGGRLAFGEHGFALVDPVPPAQTIGDGFAIGAQFSVRADWQASDWATRSTLMQRGCSLEDQLDYRVATGESWVRAWDFMWSRLEPAEGVYDWRLTDLLVDGCVARGLGVMVGTDTLITDNRPVSRYSRVPEWAQRRWPSRASQGTAGAGVTVCPVPPAEWARHLTAAATRYRGKVAVWETMNEPNIWLSAEEYTAYLRAVAGGIRAADPQAKMAGLCVTGDLGGRVLPFLDGCATFGALDLIDAVTFHPYDSRQDSSPHPADLAIRELRELCARHGKPDMALWNSELFYPTPRPVAHEYWSFLWQRGPEVARRHLTDLAGGVMRSACIESNTYCQRTLAGRSWDDRSRKPVPNRQFVVLNTLARMVGGAHPAPGGITAGAGRLHRYTRADGSPLAAAWSSDPDEAVVVLRIPGGDGRFTAFDAYGNPFQLRAEGADLVCELGPDPVYLLPVRASDAPLFDAAVIAHRDPWRISARASASPEGRPLVVVIATSRAAMALSGKVRVSVTLGGRTVAADERTLTLAGGAVDTWSLPLDPAAVPGAVLTVTVEAAPGERPQIASSTSVTVLPVATCLALAAAPVIDGAIDEAEWAGAGALAFPRGDQISAWKGPDDCSGGLRVGYHQGWLYVAAQVRDDGRGFAAKDPAAAWNRDAIELFFDLRPDRDWASDGYGKLGGQVMLGLPPAEGALLVRSSGSLGLGDRIRSAWRAVPGGWCVEAAIPLVGALAGVKPGGVLGFGAVLNDADDDTGARVRLFWAGSRHSWSDRSTLGRLVVR